MTRHDGSDERCCINHRGFRIGKLFIRGKIRKKALKIPLKNISQALRLMIRVNLNRAQNSNCYPFSLIFPQTSPTNTTTNMNPQTQHRTSAQRTPVELEKPTDNGG